MLTITNRLWAIPAAPKLLTHKPAHSFVFATMDVSVLWFVLWEGWEYESKIRFLSCFSFKILWPNFRFTFPITPKRHHFLNSFWWADCAMGIHLHLYKLAVTPASLSLLLRATRVVQINKSLFYNWNKFPIFRMKKQASRETLS